MMGPAEIVQAYMRAGEQGDWQTFANLLHDDFVFDATPVIQNKGQLLSSQKALWGAFPDLSFNLRITEVQGNVVKATYRITGTHMGLLIPPLPGKFMTIPATGKKISLPEGKVEYRLRGNKIIRQDVEANPDTAWPGILKQLGVENPYE